MDLAWPPPSTSYPQGFPSQRIPGCTVEAMHLLSYGQTQGAGIGWGDFGSLNLGDYTGLDIWLAGSAEPSMSSLYSGFRLSIATTETLPTDLGGTCVPQGDVGCYDFYGTNIEPTTQWQELKVPFTSLTQAGWGVSAPLNLEHATLLMISIWEGSVDLWISAVGLY